MRIHAGHCSDVGRRRNNEDSYLAAPELGLYAVADGVGGEAGGEVASKVAVEALGAFYRRGEAQAVIPEMEKSQLDLAVRMAARAVVSQAYGPLRRMGTTLAAIRFAQDRATIAHVGDSRVYRLRGMELLQLTVDHNLREAFRSAAGGGPARAGGALTRALAAMSESRADLRTEELRSGDVFLIASDGVTDTLTPFELSSRMRLVDPGLAARRLVTDAIAAGGTDNATAVVARVA